MGVTVDAGDGCRLRPWTLSDAPALLAALAPRDVEAVAVSHWLRNRRDEWAAGTGYAFAVVDERGGVVGNVAVTGIDRRRGAGWVSYWTAASARRRGVATRGVRALARWSYRDLGLVRLELGHRADNPASCAVAVRAGFAVRAGRRVRADVELHARLVTDPDPFH